MVEQGFELVPASFLEKKKWQVKSEWDLTGSVFCSFPTCPAFACTEIIKLQGAVGGVGEGGMQLLLLLENEAPLGSPFLPSQPGEGAPSQRESNTFQMPH